MEKQFWLPLLVLLVICIIWVSEAFICPKGISHSTNDLPPNVSKKNWTLHLTINPPGSAQDRDFYIPCGPEVTFAIKPSFHNVNRYLGERWTFNFHCTNNRSIWTFFEITKPVKRLSKNWYEGTDLRYCSGDKVLKQSKMFISYIADKELLMFYVCSKKTEFFGLLSPSFMITGNNREEINTKAPEFLSLFDSTLWGYRYQAYQQYIRESEGTCPYFKPVCLLESNENLTEHSEHWEEEESKSKCPLSASVVIAFIIIISILKIVACVRVKLLKNIVPDNDLPVVTVSTTENDSRNICNDEDLEQETVGL